MEIATAIIGYICCAITFYYLGKLKGVDEIIKIIKVRVEKVEDEE